MIKSLLISEIHRIFILGTTLLDRYELKSSRWKIEGQQVNHSRDGLQFPRVSWGFCAVFNKMIISPYLEVETISCLLGVKLDLISFPADTHEPLEVAGIRR